MAHTVKKTEDTRPDLIAVMEAAGVDTSPIHQLSAGRNRVYLYCPFHKDSGRPNMAVWLDAQSWKCFRCTDRGGDVYSFQGYLRFGDRWNPRDGAMFRQVAQELEQMDIPQVQYQPPPPRSPELARQIVHALSLASRVYHLALMSEVGKDAREYLQSRGITSATMRQLRLGYAEPGILAGALAGYPQGMREAADVAGLFHEGREWLARRVIFPDITEANTVRYLVGRDLRPDATLRYLSLPGLPRTIYLLGRAQFDRPVVLTESMVDTVNLWQLGFQGTGVNGTGIAGYLLPELQQVPLLVILPQNDDASREAAARWRANLPRAKQLDLPYGGLKDLNDLVRRYGLDGARIMLAEAFLEIGIAV